MIMMIIITIIIFFAFSMSIAVSDFFMDIHDKWKHPKCDIFCNIMQDSVSNKIIQSVLHVLSFQAQCYWMDILKLHWNYTEKPLDGVHWNYTGITLKCPWMDTLKLHCTSNSAPPAHLHLIYIFAPAPPSTTTFTNPCLAIKSEVHLSAPQKCTPPRVRCAPPNTSAHRGISGSTMAPGDTNPLPQSMLTNHQRGLVAFTWWQFHRKCSIYLPLIWLIINQRLHQHLPHNRPMS